MKVHQRKLERTARAKIQIGVGSSGQGTGFAIYQGNAQGDQGPRDVSD